MVPSKEAAAVGIDSASSSDSQTVAPATRPAGKLDVLVQGVALFSDGYNIQVIGYMNSVLAKL
jgi:hypothetical protein